MFYKKFILKNGEKLVIRDIQISDAKAFADVWNKINDETKYFTHDSKEESLTKEGIEKEINSLLEKRGAILIAEVDGKIAGSIFLERKARRQRMFHRCEITIGLLKHYWGKGIGRKLLESVEEVAKEKNYEQIELIVLEDNVRAHNLYKLFGFVDEGQIKRSFKYSDGTYMDGIMMVKFL